ncbi:MAG: hypothetical protein Q8903_14645, partial [Bacteroidota bacterium]|nr:hypothetical protein [Bacteroidota bacterium]
YRTENSGSYCISSFDIDKDNIWLNSFDTPESFCFKDNQYLSKISTPGVIKDFVKSNITLEKSSSINTSYKFNNTRLKKIFINSADNIFIDNDGEMSNQSGSMVNVKVNNKNDCEIDYAISGFEKTFHLSFPSNLAYSDLIGMDSKGNSFILIETFVSEVPLEVNREVYTLSPEGKVLSILSIPAIKYFYTIRDFQIDQDGNLYHLMTGKDGITIFKWSGLTQFSSSKIYYPEEYNYKYHYNNLKPVAEPLAAIVKNINGTVSRTNALKIGDSYVLNKYTCTAGNLAPSDITDLDGDQVRTPSWLIVGKNSKTPYKWGGFNTLAQYISGLQSGAYAGDINTAGVSSYAVGVDCSGFVSRCWQLSSHYSTSSMPTITTLYSSWDQMKPADAVLKTGHVRMYVDKASNGAIRVVESSARDWGVSYWTYTLADLTSYSPRYYNQMQSDYSVQQPGLLSVTAAEGDSVHVTWSCDTTNVKGYRLYKTTDGIIWNIIMNENVLKTCSATFKMTASAEYYRVSSVLNDSTSFTESNWSNALGISKHPNSRNILIVDGFNRETGDWRGHGESFTVNYGKFLNNLNLSFQTVKNAKVIDSSVVLNNFDAIYWMLGDESTADETFSSSEQKIIMNYLDKGGCLFVSGSEIGWDLGYMGGTSDKAFYNNYLKASFVTDYSSSSSVVGVSNTSLAGTNFNFGQTYIVGYPDVIGINGGSTLCMQYSNGKGAGVQYTGSFGDSSKTGKVIYLGFPLETTADDSSFYRVILKSCAYFFPEINDVQSETTSPLDF